jgi:hypothetical protein
MPTAPALSTGGNLKRQTILVENQPVLRLSVTRIPDQIRSWLREPRPKEQALFHGRDAEFKEIGVFLDQELFTPRPPAPPR